jgi:hypothetical protein
MQQEQRSAALKVAKWLVGKGKTDEAIAILAAWAAQGPNDATGQELMAEALRIHSAAPLARMAFERMEGVPGDHVLLDAAIQKYTAAEIEALAKQADRPAFTRAQVGFNNNVKYKDHTYHIQTEDSGLDKPHIITHLFADGGRIIKSHKREYAAEVKRPDVAQHVRNLMKGQQVEMAIMLREGKFDEVVAGRAVGGMEILKEPPRMEARRRPAADAGAATPKEKPKVIFKVQGDVAPAAPAAAAAPAAPAPSVLPVYAPPYRLIVERSAGGDPGVYEPSADIVVIGAKGEVSLKNERFCHPEEARLVWREERLWVDDLPGGNGIFLRVQHLVELEAGSEFLVGDQLLVVERNPDPYDDGPTAEPTYFYPSPKPPVSAFRITQIFEGGGKGACVLARGNSVQIGTEDCDLQFRSDPLISKQHCILEEQAGVIILTDLESRTGVFVRLHGEQEVMHGDEIIAGRTRLRVEFAQKRNKSLRSVGPSGHP